jgi:hypothetical protein
VLEDRVLRRLGPKEPRQLADGPPIGDAGRDVGPLPWIGALREEATELVERRGLRVEDPVRVVVD